VAHDDVGGDAVRGEEPGEGDVGRQHRGLGDLGLQQLLLEPGDGAGVGLVDEDELGERLAQQWRHDPVRLGERVRDHRFVQAEGLQHVDVLGALARVQEGDLGRGPPTDEHPAGAQRTPHRRVVGLQRLGRPARLVGQLGGIAVVDGDAQRCGQVGGEGTGRCGRVAGGRAIGDLAQPAGESRLVDGAGDERTPRRRLAGLGLWRCLRRRRRHPFRPCSFASGRWGPGRACRLGLCDRDDGDVDVGERDLFHAAAVTPRRVLLEHAVEVRAPESERAHAGPTNPTRRRVPWPQLGVDRERRPAEVDVRVGLLGVDARRQDLVVERHGRLEQPGGAGRTLQVADVRLHRSQGDRADGNVVAAEHLAQCLDLDHVTDRRGRAVPLDERARRRRHARQLPRTLDGQALADGVGGGDALALAVARSRHAEEHGVDAVAVPLGLGQPPEQEQRAPLAHDEAVGAVRVGAGAGRRQRADLAELHVGRGAHVAVDAAREGCVVLAVDQPFDRRGHGRQAGRARGVGDIARPPEVEEVGDPAGDDVGQLAGHGVLGDGRDGAP
jgi:hypothetical protein